jgi:hypothetical protein
VTLAAILGLTLATALGITDAALAAVRSAVHARMTLTGQPSVGGITAPRPRSNVMSLVVHQKPAGWCCASAHNTDIVPGSETNIIDDRGRLRSVGYRDKH